MDKERAYDYLTIGAAGIGEFKDRGSKFIGYAYAADSEEQVAAYIDELKRDHLKARHHCYAYVLDREGKLFRANDDGEPSGTAGKPILGQITKAELKQVLVVVVRYFGGTKLGTSGLINAYRAAAEQAIADANILEVTVKERFALAFGYGEMGHVMNVVKRQGLTMVEKDFGVSPRIVIEVEERGAELEIRKLKAALLDISLDRIDEETEVDFCTIKKQDK